MTAILVLCKIVTLYYKAVSLTLYYAVSLTAELAFGLVSGTVLKPVHTAQTYLKTLE